ncbi:MAG: dihydroorotate dehydrogenase-like protein [Planctomycetes bacterium]|nr:dihydroorotate dehydrogenase-like protein [Planctomycetota bacterium]
MVDLSTTYMGLPLANPIIVGSSSLTMTADGVRRCADAGAGAVVLKSIFEEQIEIGVRELEATALPAWHAEALAYVRAMGMSFGPRKYLELIRAAKASVPVPIIASLNCITPAWWREYAQQIAAEGADALELNISFVPSDPGRTSVDVENLYGEIVGSVAAAVKIPVAVKLSPHLTSIAHVAADLARRGAAALVLFNRFYEIDIDVEEMRIASGYPFSTEREMGHPLRWVALLAGRVRCDVAASTGVHDGKAVVKQLLAGASAVQIVSELYANRVERIGAILDEVREWMERHGFGSLEAFRGKLSQLQSPQPELYERLQYIKALVGME